jgi:hypothetical protein
MDHSAYDTGADGLNGHLSTEGLDTFSSDRTGPNSEPTRPLTIHEVPDFETNEASLPKLAPVSMKPDLTHLSKEQQYYIGVLQSLGRPSSNQEIYAEHRRQHPDDPRTDKMLKARIRTELQRYCETSSQFKDFGKKKNLKIFTNPSPGTWWLVPEYAPGMAIEQVSPEYAAMLDEALPASLSDLLPLVSPWGTA